MADQTNETVSDAWLSETKRMLSTTWVPSPAKERLAIAVDEIDRLRDVLRDIAVGASMMIEPPVTARLHPYALEVRRVAEAALGRNNAALRESQT